METIFKIKLFLGIVYFISIIVNFCWFSIAFSRNINPTKVGVRSNEDIGFGEFLCSILPVVNTISLIVCIFTSPYKIPRKPKIWNFIFNIKK